MLRRTIQITSLAAFVALLTIAILTAADTSVFEWVLGADPAIAGITAISGRIFVSAFIPAIVLMVLGFAVGRGFCGYVCPMGTCVDGIDKIAGKTDARKQPRSEGWRHTKFLVLGLILGAGLLGVSLVYVASPFSLMTRLWGLLVYPLAVAIAEAGLWAIRPIAELADWHAVTFAKVVTPSYDTQLFLLIFLGGLAVAARISPRFWCRNLCPAGAMLALTSFRPVLRRRVSDACGGCGHCATVCPMGAIDLEDLRITRFDECILCRTCQTACPKGAVTFVPSPEYEPIGETAGAFPAGARRQFLVGGLAGLGTAAFSLSGLAMARTSVGSASSPPETTGFLRPPGAVPEADFLSRCVRCAACVAVCPHNALQPLYDGTGLGGLFSPGLVPAGGYCDPNCSRCGAVCPTDAIIELTGDERLWAKTGTAAIVREDCLAWENKEKCMVCDEVCPFDAVVFKLEPGHPVTVPHVEENKCVGCGYCENACPVKRPAAIRVSTKGSLRLLAGSYVEEGRKRGLDIALDSEKKAGVGSAQYPDPPAAGTDQGGAPGFDAPAPGFSP